MTTGLDGHSSSAFLVAFVKEKIVVGNFLGRLEIYLFDGFFGGNSGRFDFLYLLVVVVEFLPLLNYRIKLIVFSKHVILRRVGVGNKGLVKTLAKHLTFDAFAIDWVLGLVEIIIIGGVLFFGVRLDYDVGLSLGLLLLGVWLGLLFFVLVLGVE